MTAAAGANASSLAEAVATAPRLPAALAQAAPAVDSAEQRSRPGKDLDAKPRSEVEKVVDRPPSADCGEKPLPRVERDVEEPYPDQAPGFDEKMFSKSVEDTEEPFSDTIAGFVEPLAEPAMDLKEPSGGSSLKAVGLFAEPREDLAISSPHATNAEPPAQPLIKGREDGSAVHASEASSMVSAEGWRLSTAAKLDGPKVPIAPSAAGLTALVAAPPLAAFSSLTVSPRHEPHGWKRVAELEGALEMSRERVKLLDAELRRKDQEIDELRSAAKGASKEPVLAGIPAAIAMSRDADDCQSAHDSEFGVADHQLLSQAAQPAVYDMSRAMSDCSSPRDSEFGLGASQFHVLEQGMPAPSPFSRRASSEFSYEHDQLLAQADFLASRHSRLLGCSR